MEIIRLVEEKVLSVMVVCPPPLIVVSYNLDIRMVLNKEDKDDLIK